jgi:hypothetical protein
MLRFGRPPERTVGPAAQLPSRLPRNQPWSCCRSSERAFATSLSVGRQPPTPRPGPRHHANEHPRRGFRPRVTTQTQKAGQSITIRHNAFGAKKGFGCHSAGGAKATATPPHQPTVTADAPIGCGRWTSSSTSRPPGGPIKIGSVVDQHTGECSGGTVKPVSTHR